jgi:hypothetical protein
MEQNKLLVLEHAMDYRLDVFIINFIYKLENYKIAININQIIDIELFKTTYDEFNRYYYKITLTNGRKIYVNQYVIDKIYLFTLSYKINKDYELISKFFNN